MCSSACTHACTHARTQVSGESAMGPQHEAPVGIRPSRGPRQRLDRYDDPNPNPNPSPNPNPGPNPNANNGSIGTMRRISTAMRRPCVR